MGAKGSTISNQTPKMKIPKNIYDALHTRDGFDQLYLSHYITKRSHPKSYEATVNEIKEYIPEYEPQVSCESHRVTFNRNSKEVDVPRDVILDMIDFEERFYVYLKEHKIQRVAYEKMMERINRYFPNWRKYNNYQSFKNRKVK